MTRPTYDQIFDYAYEGYQGVASFIVNAVSFYNKHFEHVDKDEMLKDFDLALQISLLQTACLDGHLHYKEIEFIMNLQDYDDLPIYLTSLLKEDWDWDKIYATPAKDIMQLLNDLDEDITVKLRPLVKVIAIAYASKDPSLSFEGNDLLIPRIHACLAHVNGDASLKPEEINQTFFFRLENTAYLYAEEKIPLEQAEDLNDELSLELIRKIGYIKNNQL